MKDALDALLDRYAPEAGAGWLAAETPDIVPEHPFSSKFRRRMPWSSSPCPSPV